MLDPAPPPEGGGRSAVAFRDAQGAQGNGRTVRRPGRAVGYYSAGTVELIVSGADPSGESFYFLEMNTRLQVEHPVTECITGIDLVEQMIRVAAGEKLAFTQDDIKIDGWAIENRVYAEDPYRGFLPSTGRLVRYQPPVDGWTEDEEGNGRRGVDGVRVDDGVYEGGEVSMFYDPMIAKLITWGKTRNEAADKQIEALDRFEIEGLGHNIDFVSAIMQHPRFRSGELTTGFIAEEYPDGFTGAATSDEALGHLAAIAGFVATARADRARQIDQQLNGELEPPYEWSVTIGGRTFTVELEEEVLVNGEPLDIGISYTPGDRLIEAHVEGQTYGVKLEPTRTGLKIDDARRDPCCADPACTGGEPDPAHDREGTAGSLQVPDLPDARPAGRAARGRGGQGRGRTAAGRG